MGVRSEEQKIWPTQTNSQLTVSDPKLQNNFAGPIV